MEARSSMLAVTNMSGACVNRDAAGSGSDSLICVATTGSAWARQ